MPEILSDLKSKDKEGSEEDDSNASSSESSDEEVDGEEDEEKSKFVNAARPRNETSDEKKVNVIHNAISHSVFYSCIPIT